MVGLLRVLLYVQLVLGLARFARMIGNPRVWELHVLLGVVITILALVALRPRPEASAAGLRATARLVPLLPLATGVAMLAQVAGGLAMTLVHMVLGVLTIGLVEAAAARGRRPAA